MLISFLNLSCSEQDYFKIEGKPQILINNIGQNFVSLSLQSHNKEQTLILLISTNEKFEKNIDTISNLNFNDNIEYSNIKLDNQGKGILLNYKFKNDTTIIINGLELLKDYNLALYKYQSGKAELHQKLKFSTVVEQPTLHSKNITFSEVTDKQMTISFQPGNGEGRIVIMRKDSAPEFPTDGIEYTYNQNYGNDSTLINNNSFVVYKTTISADNKFTVKDLKPGKYYVSVIEYNGNGKHISYLGEFNGNIRSKNTSLKAPVALPAEVVDINNFVAKWEKHPDVEYFLLDIAEDEKFVNIVQPYEGVDVGDSNLVEIELPFGLDEREIYYRVRAFANGTITGSSNVIKVTKQDIKGK